jgi:hypothetical protein
MALWVGVSSPAGAEESIRIGVAETDITPPKDFLMAGYYHERKATGTHDPLKAKAIVFRDNNREAALVVCDLIGIGIDLSTEVRKRITTKIGIPAAHIVVSATHSHTAPDYMKDLYEILGEVDKESARQRHPYAAKLIDGIVEAVVQAHARAVPAIVQAGSAQQEIPVAFDRRFLMKDGSVRIWMQLNQPDVLRAAGPIDPEIGLLLVRSADDNKR